MRLLRKYEESSTETKEAKGSFQAYKPLTSLSKKSGIHKRRLAPLKLKKMPEPKENKWEQ